MHKQTACYPAAILFDLDGVLIDTEPQYDVFWKKVGEKFLSGFDDFEQVIKGTALPDIISRYFSHLSEKEQLEIVRLNHDFEMRIEFPYVSGAFEFLQSVRQHKEILTALVTSSEDFKLRRVFEVLKLEKYFDTIVSADRITTGKPNPECYLLAAKDLQVRPEDCLVFEDSLHGIAAGNSAGMKVVGLSTTNPADLIRDKVWKVIPDFERVSPEDFCFC